jgi:hypothetical protein
MTATTLVFLIASSALAEDSGFLTDYSKLAPGGEYGFTRADLRDQPGFKVQGRQTQ